MTETAQEKFNREKKEYNDAAMAYERMLGGIAAKFPDPASLIANYGSANAGWERLGKGDWLAQRFPMLKAAGEKVAAEERDFMALDDSSASHAKDTCSIPGYIADKFYEYVALAEMLYTLATDEAAREAVFAALRKSPVGRYLSAPRGDAVYHTFGYLKDHWFGNPADAQEHRKRAQEALDEWEAAGDGLIDAIGESLKEIYAEFKKRFTECGLTYGIATIGVDGVFLVGEGLTGVKIAGVTAKAIKSLRLTVTPRKDGSFLVSATAEGGGKLERSFTKDALEAKYGKPSDNHVGGLSPDTNRPLPDKSAEEMLQEQKASPSFTHPRDGKAVRSRSELLPRGKVPYDSKDPAVFQKWWDDLSVEELKDVSANRDTRDEIASRVRGKGGMHEWLKVSQQLEHKRLGFSMKEIQDWVTATDKAEGPLPQGGRWRHKSEGGRGAGPGSGTMHNALDELYGPPPAANRNDLLRRMGYFANSYLDGGIDGLPAGLRGAILTAGGG